MTASARTPMFTSTLCDYRRGSCNRGSGQSEHGASEWWRDPRAIPPASA